MINNTKLNIEFQNSNLHNYEIHRGEIHWVNLGDGIGSEQKNIRPCLVVSNSANNRYSTTVTVVPITSTIKQLPTRVTIRSFCLHYESQSAAEQVRTVDKKRFTGYMGHVDEVTMRHVDQSLKVQMDLN